MSFCSQELQLKNIELDNDELNVKTYDNIRALSGMYNLRAVLLIEIITTICLVFLFFNSSLSSFFVNSHDTFNHICPHYS